MFQPAPARHAFRPLGLCIYVLLFQPAPARHAFRQEGSWFQESESFNPRRRVMPFGTGSGNSAPPKGSPGHSFGVDAASVDN